MPSGFAQLGLGEVQETSKFLDRQTEAPILRLARPKPMAGDGNQPWVLETIPVGVKGTC